MAETYKLKLYASGPFVGCVSEETVDLIDYGLTDEEWDMLDERDRGKMLDEFAAEFLYNEGYESNAEVVRG